MDANKARRTCKEEIGGCRATTKPRGCYWGMSVVGGGLIGVLLKLAKANSLLALRENMNISSGLVGSVGCLLIGEKAAVDSKIESVELP